jgi:hypothetical protein
MVERVENTFKGPTYRYGPNGEAEIFTDSTLVPAGWTDTPTSAGEEAPPAPADHGMARADIVAALKAGNIQFKANAKTSTLYDDLLGALISHAAAQEITVPEGATAPDILKLLEVSPQS